PVRTAWLARAEGLGGPLVARLADRTLEGRFDGIDAGGALLLSQPGREAPTRIAAGDVFFAGGT
ncbi:MAG: biotin--[acetyl-CoA-carboxylase] ligase, partial [Alphaproteobacteria bacterium]|nr:biotin--[acetyl-CoA-carboxylase] ligase [Alphaproteobacteria bacterium]